MVCPQPGGKVMLAVLVRVGVLAALFVPPLFAGYLTMAILDDEGSVDKSSAALLAVALLGWSIMVGRRLWPGAWRGWSATHLRSVNLRELGRRSGIIACILSMIWFAFDPGYAGRSGVPHYNFAGVLVAIVFLILLLRLPKEPLIEYQGARYTVESQSGVSEPTKDRARLS